jgi:hypothetical protein
MVVAREIKRIVESRAKSVDEAAPPEPSITPPTLNGGQGGGEGCGAMCTCVSQDSSD